MSEKIGRRELFRRIVGAAGSAAVLPFAAKGHAFELGNLWLSDSFVGVSGTVLASASEIPRAAFRAGESLNAYGRLGPIIIENQELPMITRADGTAWQPGEPYGHLKAGEPNAIHAHVFDAETGARIERHIYEADDREGWYRAYKVGGAGLADELERIEHKIRIEIQPRRSDEEILKMIAETGQATLVLTTRQLEKHDLDRCDWPAFMRLEEQGLIRELAMRRRLDDQSQRWRLFYVITPEGARRVHGGVAPGAYWLLWCDGDEPEIGEFEEGRWMAMGEASDQVAPFKILAGPLSKPVQDGDGRWPEMTDAISARHKPWGFGA